MARSQADSGATKAPSPLKNKLFLLSELLRRDLAARYAGSYAGPLWAVLNPAIVCLLNAFVFAYVLRVLPPSGFNPIPS